MAWEPHRKRVDFFHGCSHSTVKPESPFNVRNLVALHILRVKRLFPSDPRNRPHSPRLLPSEEWDSVYLQLPGASSFLDTSGPLFIDLTERIRYTRRHSNSSLRLTSELFLRSQLFRDGRSCVRPRIVFEATSAIRTINSPYY